MWSYGIPVLCVLAHAHLVLVLLPAFWREIDRRGYGWHALFTLFVVPLLVATGVASQAVADLAAMPTWFLVVAFLTLDALLLRDRPAREEETRQLIRSSGRDPGGR